MAYLAADGWKLEAGRTLNPEPGTRNSEPGTLNFGTRNPTL
jgi:hypothetical protein